MLMKDPVNLAWTAGTPPGVIRLVGVLFISKPTSANNQDKTVNRLYLNPGLTEWVDIAKTDVVDSDRDGLGNKEDALDKTSLAPTTVWVKGNAQLTYARSESFQFGAEFLDGDILALLRRQRRLAAATTLGGIDELDNRDPLLGDAELPTSTRTSACIKVI
jgi:hypothetical protein